MEIRKFDALTHDLNKISELILRAYSEGDQAISLDDSSKNIVMDLVEAGNNFLGHENIYLCITDNNIAGLFIGYTGKSYSKVKTLFDLLIKLKLTQILNYILAGSQLFDAVYTPNIDEDDFYISVIVVDENYRGQGFGVYMLKESVRVAKELGCKKIVLDVNRDNTIAQSLYSKFGFMKTIENHENESDGIDSTYYSMEYLLN